LSLLINGNEYKGIHFTGIFGSGMSAIAQYLRWQGLYISGSDRLNDSTDTVSIRNNLEKIGCEIFPQDGSGVSEKTDAVCVSTAIEEGNADIIAARSRNIPVFHRSDLLAAIIKGKNAIAVAGTSGKSTVTAMIFEFLTQCGKNPSLISGAALRRLESEGLIGNAFYGKSDLLVIEADESDGTLVKYTPFISVFLNVSKDHKTIPEVISLFKQLSENSGWTAVNADDPNLKDFEASVKFGKGDDASYRPEQIILQNRSINIIKDNLTFELPLPGAHNAQNCLAALCVCEYLGCNQNILCEAVKNYKGVARRFSINNTEKGVFIVDDFAHNPEKIKAAIIAARGLSDRLFVIYQPHGFGPTRFLKEEYATTFRTVLSSSDTLFLLPIYYAGGTAVKDISSYDIIDLIGEVPFKAIAPENRDEILLLIKDLAKSGDCVLLMGARDPSLPAFVKKLVDQFNTNNPR
jgi:UDP-N-acetylmuramate--alanine ligase